MILSFQKKKHTGSYQEQLSALKEELQRSDAVLIGAGSGLSASAGFAYSGERFERLFGDFIEKYHISDMYAGGFYPWQSLEEYWAWWSRHIFVNRYEDAPKPIYQELLKLVQDKDYFVLTTNVDHCFQKAGFDKERLFYTQGDYGLWQCSEPCCQKTYDNETQVRRMVERQHDMQIPTELIPRCPVCGKPMTMNLRCDSTFVQDEGWYAASGRYEAFLQKYKGERILFLEIGVGGNTPGVIKYPFWKYTYENPNARYVTINCNEAFAPSDIAKRSICIEGDIGAVLQDVS